MHELKDFLKFLGFKPKEGQSNYWYKQYKSFSDYEISVIIKSSQDVVIDFGELIQVERKSTSSLNTAENYVVLECVNRLIEKGYRPQSIVLEKKWKLGHEGKGFLDIQVIDGLEQSFLMIECKTWGKEFSKAEEDTLKNGGQLFSYLQQEPNTKYICLYTSKFENNVIQYRSNIIENTEKFKNKNQSQLFEVWDKVFEEKGIFEEHVSPYNIKFTELLKSDLKTLEQEDGGKIFNLFAEILRRNVVSDKNNAFNKIFNLFLCKIVDEDKKRDDDEMAFQWKKQYDKLNLIEKNAGYKEFLGTLNDLYKEGIKDYLQIEVTDYSKDEVETLLQMFPTASEEAKGRIKMIIEELRFYKSNEFAFKEVNNKESFEENAKIVKEMVELLQGYKLKYSAKHQFLGDFFENLLNTGIKQESGQFFTPTPIASFICKSLPIWSIIENKNNREEVKFLPHVIDFASGSGHFLTESMDEINYYVENKIDDNWIKGGKRAKDEFEAGKKSYKWAKEYVYGIEKDYRLAKTTKISAFLNGDGDANVICGDGLGNFKYDKKYIGLLKSDTDSKDNQKFDVLVANPPYSVDEFKVTIEDYGKESFELFSGLSDQASEIECLFIERTKQLLKDGGVAGIILPISILSNGKIHMRARELILKYFEIKAIVEFGANTFMATGTNTATLFLKRRSNNDWKIIQNKVDEFFTNFRDVTVNGIESVFSNYVEYVFENISLKDYVSFFTNDASEEILNSEIIKDYKSAFKKLSSSKLTEAIQDIEKEKLLYFILTYKQKYVLVKAPSDNNTEKEFLGYEFSNRRGNEGIKIYKDTNGNNVTKLFNSDYEALYDETKVNSYILKAFENKEIPIPIQELKEVLQVQHLHESIDFERANFEKRISTEFGKKKVSIESRWELVTLEKICNIKIGGTPSRKIKEYYQNGENLWVSIAEMDGQVILDTKEKINDLGVKNSNVKLIKKNTTLLSFKLSLGKTAIAGKDLYTNEAIAGLEVKFEFRDLVIDTYLFYLFKSQVIDLKSIVGGKVFGKSLNSEDLKKIKIPLPPLEVQDLIVKEMRNIDKSESEIEKEIRERENEIEGIIEYNLINHSGYQKYKLKNLLEINPPKQTFTDVEMNISFIDMASVRNEGGIEKMEIKKVKEVIKKGYTGFKEGDILFAKITPCMENGKGAIAENLVNEYGFGSTEFYIFRTGDKVKSKLIYYFSRLKSFRKRAEQNMTGTSGHRRVAKMFIEDYEIYLPPLFEQERLVKQIVAIEDKITDLKEELSLLKINKAEVLKKHL